MENKKKDDLRAPVVTLMGHVDHGKTTLLDTIRKTNVVAGEHGGITQHIGAYQAFFNAKPITFIDTPGHAAFEKMRWRGAKIADIVVLVVSASEGAKPQTVEAIKHIKAEEKPIIVAATKVDLPNINLEKLKKELEKNGVLIEEYGGDVPFVEVSAPKGVGIDNLLELIQLVWQISPQAAFLNDPLEAQVIESYMDKSRGPVATLIVKKGVLKLGQKITIGGDAVTVRALTHDLGKDVKEASSGKPVEVLGFKKTLEVGSTISDVNVQKDLGISQQLRVEDIIAKSQEAKDRFKVIIKADVIGSLEAILSNLASDVLVVSSGLGEVNSTDVSFAKVAHAPILAFNVKIPNSIKANAEREKVIIKNYNVIYQLLADVEAVAASFAQAKQELKISGRAKIVAVFDIEGKKIAGALVTEGKLRTGDRVMLKRPGSEKEAESNITSLKRYKKDAPMVSSGQDCGVLLSPSVDFREGDIIESLG